MKRINKNSLTLLSLGITLLSLSFIIEHYFLLSDGANGLLKGVSIGLLLLNLIVSFKAKKQQVKM